MSKDSKTPQAFPYSGEGDELNYSKGMTLRQYAAIKLKVPESGTGWLDRMIKVSLHDEFAASFVTSGNVFKNLSSGSTTDEVAAQAYALADAMLEARKGGV